MEELCQLTCVPIPPAFLCAIFMLLTTYNNSFLHNLNTYLVSNTDTGSLIIGGDWNVTPGGGGEDSHMKVTGMLVGKLELTP